MSSPPDDDPPVPRDPARGIANFAVSLLLGVTAAWAGRHLGVAM